MWKLVVCLGMISVTVEAGVLELKYQSKTIFIQEKTEWKLGKDLFGMPFIYFSPEINGQRSNISFTDTGAEAELDTKSISETQKTYQENKKKWAQQVGASAESFLPYEMFSNKHGHKIHKIGFNFEHDGKVYQEKSFYIECRDKILFAKALRLKENEIHDKDFNELLNSVDCGGV